MDQKQILDKLLAGEITREDADKMLAELAKPPARGALYCKVSEKGAVSVYGLQRMPVTLYVEQWERLLDFGPDLRTFLADNTASLKRKA